MDAATIMIVEDEAVVALHIAQRLKGLGHTVAAIARSGAEAVQQATALRPDLILMDIRLEGGMDGIEAAKQIRAREDIPIVYLTAYADEATLQRAKITEPYGYLLKPFQTRDLQINIEMALHKHTMQKALEKQRAEFLSMLTHDIKNPLSIIMGYAEMLADEVRAHGLPEAAEIAAMIESNVLAVLSLVTNYLYCSTREGGALQFVRKPVKLDEILRAVGQRYSPEAQRRGLELHVCSAADLPLVEASTEALERVFANLVDNALKFTPERGKIQLDARFTNGEVVASVADSGVGIPEEQLPLIFDKYRRAAADESRTGIGLGLFIVRELVQAHGGRVEVASTPGAGTCFSVFLPPASGTALEPSRD
jgi:signal transduction histidine kinase